LAVLLVDMEGTGTVQPTDASTDAPPLSFEAFYEATFPSMVRLAWALVDVREIAEEAVQDAYVALYGRFATVEHPAAYVRMSVVNNCRNILRHRRITRRHVELEPDEATDDAYDHLFDVVRNLAPRHREVIVLRYHAGLRSYFSNIDL